MQVLSTPRRALSCDADVVYRFVVVYITLSLLTAFRNVVSLFYFMTFRSTLYRYLQICKFEPKAIETQSGWLALHCRLLISPSALYAKMGSSTGRFAIVERSHIKACESSPATQTKSARVIRCMYIQYQFFPPLLECSYHCINDS
jgi:hypothetical protein